MDALTSGERVVWAARFALALQSGCDATTAARYATGAVVLLRDIDATKVDGNIRECLSAMTRAYQ